jgi:hypothetical protein
MIRLSGQTPPSEGKTDRWARHVPWGASLERWSRPFTGTPLATPSNVNNLRMTKICMLNVKPVALLLGFIPSRRFVKLESRSPTMVPASSKITQSLLVGAFFAAQSSVDCTTNMFGFDFRQAQAGHEENRPNPTLSKPVWFGCGRRRGRAL